MGLEQDLTFDDASLARDLFGPENSHVAALAEKSGVDIQTSGASAHLKARSREELDLAAQVLVQLYGLIKSGHVVHARDVAQSVSILRRDGSISLAEVFQDTVCVASPRKRVSPKTLTQKEYVSAIRGSDMVFAIGPAGTGKTYLAVAMAVSALLSREVKRLVLTRPAVEAGEKLGFLPGDLVEKVNPYLRPLYDALNDMLGFAKVREMLDSGIIEIAPLAFMRGRTLNDAFIILDEAQNTTPEQMKMFLTRMGFGSRMVITGDITQIDLPERNGTQPRSGLVTAERILGAVKGIRFIHFHKEDVIRHDLVGRIVHAYEHHTEPGEAD